VRALLDGRQCVARLERGNDGLATVARWRHHVRRDKRARARVESFGVAWLVRTEHTSRDIAQALARHIQRGRKCGPRRRVGDCLRNRRVLLSGHVLPPFPVRTVRTRMHRIPRTLCTRVRVRYSPKPPRASAVVRDTRAALRMPASSMRTFHTDDDATSRRGCVTRERVTCATWRAVMRVVARTFVVWNPSQRSDHAYALHPWYVPRAPMSASAMRSSVTTSVWPRSRHAHARVIAHAMCRRCLQYPQVSIVPYPLCAPRVGALHASYTRARVRVKCFARIRRLCSHDTPDPMHARAQNQNGRAHAPITRLRTCTRARRSEHTFGWEI